MRGSGPVTATFDVSLTGMPRSLTELSWERTEEIGREFRLMTASGRDIGDLPGRITLFLNRMHRAADGREALLGIGLNEVPDHGGRLDMVLRLPVGAEADAVLLALLMDEADAYCARGEVLTLERPPALVALRWWQATEVARQRHGLAPTAFAG